MLLLIGLRQGAMRQWQRLPGWERERVSEAIVRQISDQWLLEEREGETTVDG